MVKFLSQLLLTFSLIFGIKAAYAHIHMIEKWTNGTQYIYCLSDYHISSLSHNKINNQQRLDIVAEAKKRNACVIVEDSLYHNINDLVKQGLSFDPNENYSHKITDKIFFGLTYFEPDTPPIIGLTAYCHKANVTVDNIEFRQLKLTSLQEGYIDSKTAIDFSDAIKDQILAYNDTPALNKYYHKKINEYITTILKPCESLFQLLYSSEQPLNIAKESIPYETHYDSFSFLDRTENVEIKRDNLLTIYDTRLIDLRIIHSIFTHKDVPVLFVCAGGSHIERIKPALRCMGFTQIDRNGCFNTEDEPTALSISNYFTLEGSKLSSYADINTNIILPGLILVLLTISLSSLGIYTRKVYWA